MEMTYNLNRVHEVATNMSKRYSTFKVAIEMAHVHSMDHPRHSEGRRFWEEVGRELSRLSRLPKCKNCKSPMPKADENPFNQICPNCSEPR